MQYAKQSQLTDLVSLSDAMYIFNSELRSRHSNEEIQKKNAVEIPRGV